MAENGLFPVSLDRHSNRYWRRFTSYCFAEEIDACPVVISEIPQIATSFPIVFRLIKESFVPVALFSIIPDTVSPFVCQSGRWLAPYVPSALRCFPFQAETACESGARSRLLVNESSGLVTRDPQDNPFFTKDGQLSQNLSDVLHFFQNRQVAAIETDRQCSIIAAMDLFEPLQQHEETTLPQGYWGIDAQRLEHLPDAYNLTLLASGTLRLIHAHQVSLSHCAWLLRAQERGAFQDAEPCRKLDGFIAAIAEDVYQGQARQEVIHAMG
ncbi:SapC protein [Ruegeria halocynthiae]|uniref:SapC protein n=1 Tax=Ruegeria halocynthiae TaxID=985054 RepID=A0A1H2Y6T0_9RHOB|nr:SapC family protein [Ruegeria halocynthiae]SDX00269.1 SapC protein [Ruegeria halocynthiae]